MNEDEEFELRICPLNQPGGSNPFCEGKDCMWFMGGECAIVKIARSLERIARITERGEKK